MVWRREVWRRCLLVVAVLPHAVSAFVAAPLSAGGPFHAPCLRRAAGGRALGKMQAEAGGHSPRRVALVGLGAMVALGLGAPIAPVVADSCTRKDCQPQANFLPDGDAPKQKDLVKMPGLQGKNYGKTTYNYPDYTKTETGLQYKDVKAGSGASPETGDRVVFDWEGYTIGYYGRIFKAKNGVKGGAFDADTEFERFIVGGGTVVPGLEEGILSMKVGGVRQIVVPPEIGYPQDDPQHDKVGPKPPNFDGQRALNFVLYNQGLIDKTLLFNVKLIRIDKADGKGGFKRGEIQATPAGAKATKADKKSPPKRVEAAEEEEEEE